ncbi:MAG: SRPBCC family protein [Thermoleophilaceae bacterium]
MSAVHEQTLVDAPVPTVWDLVGNPDRYPEWFPRVFEIDGERFEEGAEFVMVSKQPITGRDEAHLLVDRREELRELHMHCTLSGMFVHWQLTDAQGGTFVDAEFGMDPLNRRYQAFDFALGRRFFRRWLSEAMTGLKEAASPTRATS